MFVEFPLGGFKGLRLTAGRRPSNDFWLMVWEDWAEIPRANPCLPVWKQSGPMLSAGCAHVGPSRAHVEPSWAHLGFMLGQARPSTHVEPSGPSGPILAQVGPMLGSSWSHVGRMLALCWPMLGLCLSMLSHLGSYVGVMLRPFIYVETILRCQFFLPGPLLEPEHRQDEIPCRRRARNTVKNDVF